jgi:hypothetical protein
LFHVHRARYSRIASLCRGIYGVGYLLDAADLDVTLDVDRVYTTSPDTLTLDAAHVFEHSLDRQRSRAAFEAVIDHEEAHASRVDDLGFPAAHISIGTTRRLFAAPTPQLFVTLPEGEIVGALQLVASGGLPEARGPEVARLGARWPAESVRGVGFPASLELATMDIELSASGGALVQFRARSRDPAQAAIDAKAMTVNLDDTLTLDLSIIEMRVLGPFEFASEGRYVTARLVLSRDELEWVVGMARTVVPGG